MTARAEVVICPVCGRSTFPNCCVIAQHEYELSQKAEARARAKVRAALELHRDAQRFSVDFIARLADAWDFKGQNVFRATGDEHRALLQLASLPLELRDVKWSELTGEQRQSLVWSAKRAVHLGRLCAWFFGG